MSILAALTTILTQTLNAQSQSLRIFTSNVRGIVKNWKSIKQIDFNNYDILLFNEIWQVRDFENLNIPEFKLANIFQRTENRGGGVVIFVRDTLKYSKKDSPVLNGVLESTSIILDKLVILSIYRPPSGDKNLFVEKLIEWIESQRGNSLYIAGDFNLNYLSQDKAFYDIIKDSTELEPRITKITRVISNSCIDNILTNYEGVHHVSDICIADHQGLVSTITANVIKKQKQRYAYRDMRDENWTKFSIEIEKIRIVGNNVNEKWSNLLESIKIAVDLSFPIRNSKVKYTFTMSPGLLRAKNKKNKLLRDYKAGRIPKETYVRYNRVYRKLVYKEQEKTFNKNITECGTDSKKNGEHLKMNLK